MQSSFRSFVAGLVAAASLSSVGFAQGFVAQQTPNLRLTAEGNRMEVTGGEALAPCYILVGITEGLTRLPGATLRVEALAVIEGRFDESGKFEWSYERPSDPIQPFAFLAQAVSVSSDADRFYASKARNVQMDDFGNMVSSKLLAAGNDLPMWNSARDCGEDNALRRRHLTVA